MSLVVNLISSGSFIIDSYLTGFAALHHGEKQTILTGNRGSIVESKINNLRNKLGIKKPIEFIENSAPNIITVAQGVAIFSGRAGIIMNPGYFNDLDQTEFFIARDLSFIKANDHLWLGGIPSTLGVITTLGMSILFPASATYFSTLGMLLTWTSSPAAMIGVTVTVLTKIILSKWRQKCADKQGFSICSDKAKTDAIQVFKRKIASNIAYRNEEVSRLSRLWRKFTITKEGNDRLDCYYPSYTSRINYLEGILSNHE